MTLALNFSPMFQAVLNPCIPAPIITNFAFFGSGVMVKAYFFGKKKIQFFIEL